MLSSEGRNEALPVMPFHELAEVVGDAVKSVKSDAIKKSFKASVRLFLEFWSKM